jgi:hypothetical protein
MTKIKIIITDHHYIIIQCLSFYFMTLFALMQIYFNLEVKYANDLPTGFFSGVSLVLCSFLFCTACLNKLFLIPKKKKEKRRSRRKEKEIFVVLSRLD